MESKQCEICNSLQAEDEVIVLLSKKIPKTSLTKLVTIPCCHNCKALLSSQEKRARKTRWIIFFVSLVILSVSAVICSTFGIIESLSACLGLSAVASFFMAHIVYSLFIRSKHERIERQECEAAGIQHIGDHPAVQGYFRQGYRIHNRY